MTTKDAVTILVDNEPLPPALIEPWLREGDRVLLFAQTGLGKSWVGLKLAHSLASGSKFLRWTPAKTVKVAYFDGEMGESQVNAVLQKIEAGADAPLRMGNFQMTGASKENGFQLPDLSDYESQRWYDKKSSHCDVIIIDNLLTCSRLQGPKDDDFRQWARIQPWIVKNSLLGKTVILIHHSGKSGDQLGTSTRETMMTVSIKLTPLRGVDFNIEEGSKFEWHWKKVRGVTGEDKEPLLISHFTNEQGAQKWSAKSLKEHQKTEFEKLFYRYGLLGTQHMLGLSNGEAQALKGLLIKENKEEDPW